MTDTIKWDNRYSTNIETIDNHHKKLFKIFSVIKLEMDKADNCSDEKLLSEMRELLEYTTYHFSLEEEMMKKVNYNKLEEHVEMHEAFKERVISLFNEIELVGNTDMFLSILETLHNWLKFHILFVDQDYVRFLSKED